MALFRAELDGFLVAAVYALYIHSAAPDRDIKAVTPFEVLSLV